MKNPRIILLSAALLGPASAGLSAELDYYRDVYPFLKANCISCHNKTMSKADLDMETPEMMKKGGESGPAIVPGKSAESLIVQAALHEHDMEMPPPNNKSGAVNLSPSEIGILKQWIDQGAKNSAQAERTVAWQPLAAGVHPIYSVAMTKDGRYAACGRSNQIFVYDLATRQLVGQINDPAEKGGTAHRALVQSLAFSPDGKHLASGSFREVKIWRMEQVKAAPQTSPVPALAPVNEALLKKIAETGKVTLVSSAMSADGKQVVTGCADGSVRVWDAATAKQLMELRGSVAANQKIAELDWTMAAQQLESSFQKSEISRTETQGKSLDELLKKANEAIVAMKKVLPEKQKLVKPAVEAREAAQKVADDAAAKIAAVAPGAKPDPALGKELKEAQDKLITAQAAETSALAAVSATESNVKDAEEDVQRITDSKAKNAKTMNAANTIIAAAKATLDKATAELAAVKEAQRKATTKPIAVTFSADAQRVAALFDDSTLRVWAVATGQPIEESNAGSAGTTTITAGPDGSFTASKTVSLTTGSTPRWVLERTLGGDNNHGLFADRVNAVCFSPDGKTLATGGGEPSRSGDIILFDLATGKATQTWKDRHEDTVLSLDFSHDGKLLASGAADKLAKVTNVASGKQANLFEGHTHHVLGVAFRVDGRVLATAGADGVVISWNMILGERKKKIEGWTKEVTSLQFIGATNQIVTSAGDNRVRIVNDEGAEVRSMANLPDYMQSSVSTPSGSTIIAGGEDSFLRVWDGTNGKELAAFGAK